MPDLHLSRDYPVAPETLFDLVTTRSRIVQWFGHDTTTIVDECLDFSRLGPWHSVLQSAEGQRFKVSGHVTHLHPPESLGFTWAWHDALDQRGAESHVTLTVTASQAGARLIVDHRDVPTPEIAERHQHGWTVAMNRLARIAKPGSPGPTDDNPT